MTATAGWTSTSPPAPRSRWGPRHTGPNRLYKNLGDGRFRDVTESSGLGFRGFCHGIIAGDIDNDGDPDVFLCNYGPNVLYLNNGDGTFRDISHAAGIDRPNWSSGGAMLDYDNDGDLDIYVANYGDWLYPAMLTDAATIESLSSVRPGRSGRSSTSSIATTATGPSPT